MADNDSAGGAPLTRRAMLKYASTGLLGLSVLRLPAGARPAVAAGEAAVAVSPPAHRFSRMVQEWLVARVAEIAHTAEMQRAALRTRAEAEAYVRATRAKVQQCFGAWPERTPLNPRVTRQTEHGAYRIEHVIFESRPGFLVTANLYVPAGRSSGCPAVLGLCGHQASGKADPRYQAFAQGLVRQGYVVLLIDPVGQGERSQYVDGAGHSVVKPGTRQHFLAGDQQVLVGEFLGTWRAWDGIRALDYLLTRPEVDATRVGVTGHSGGGTMTAWLAGVESRLTMAAPVCFVSTFRHNLENELSADPEQYPPGALVRGLDHADFLVPLAPKPLILLGEEKDFGDVRGLEEAAGRLRQLYALLGASDGMKLHVAPGYHNYSPENRREMYRWFNRAARMPEDFAELEAAVESEEALWCTPHGQVAELGSRTVFSFTRERAKALAQGRHPLAGAELASAVAAVLRLPLRSGVPVYRILRPLLSPGYPVPHVASYAVETEPSIFAIVYRLHREDLDVELVARPPRTGGRAVLYLAHQSADAELRDEPMLRDLLHAESTAAVFLCDVRGVGESRPGVGGLPANGPDTGDSFHAAYGLMLDYSSVGQRTHDVLRVLDWLRDCGHEEVHLCASGWATPPATFAALLSPQVTQVTLKHALTSFAAVAETEHYHCPLSLMPPGVLAVFDLPDCYQALAGKNLTISEPWSPNRELT